MANQTTELLGRLLATSSGRLELLEDSVLSPPRLEAATPGTPGNDPEAAPASPRTAPSASGDRPQP